MTSALENVHITSMVIYCGRILMLFTVVIYKIPDRAITQRGHLHYLLEYYTILIIRCKNKTWNTSMNAYNLTVTYSS